MRRDELQENSMSQPEAKPYEELRLSDDFMFWKVMLDKANCQTMLERLLGKSIESLSVVTGQHSVKPTKEGKGVRYDIHSIDNADIHYVAEMQNRSEKKRKDKYLSKRVRYYFSMMDTQQLDSGEEYNTLKDSYVIFICRFDPFGKGLCCYSFESICEELPELALGDGRKAIFYYTKGKHRNVSPEAAELLDFIEYGTVSGEYSARLEGSMEKARMNKEWREEYMTNMLFYWDALDDGKEIGRELGREQGKLELLLKWITAEKITEEEAAEEMEISVEEFRRLAEENKSLV